MRAFIMILRLACVPMFMMALGAYGSPTIPIWSGNLWASTYYDLHEHIDFCNNFDGYAYVDLTIRQDFILTEPIYVNPTCDLTIQSDTGRHTLIGNFASRIFVVNGGTLTAKNIIIYGGRVASTAEVCPDNDCYYGIIGGGAVAIGLDYNGFAYGTATFDNVRFENNGIVENPSGYLSSVPTYGGAVAVFSGTLTLKNCQFVDNYLYVGVETFDDDPQARGAAVALVYHGSGSKFISTINIFGGSTTWHNNRFISDIPCTYCRGEDVEISYGYLNLDCHTSSSQAKVWRGWDARVRHLDGTCSNGVAANYDNAYYRTWSYHDLIPTYSGNCHESCSSCNPGYGLESDGTCTLCPVGYDRGDGTCDPWVPASNAELKLMTQAYCGRGDGVLADGPGTQAIGRWDVSGITSLGSCFRDCSTFNEDISGWNTATVTSFHYLFVDAHDFNQDIGAWNTQSVTDATGMFIRAYSFNQYIGDWDTHKMTKMDYMFWLAVSFDAEIGDWDTRNVQYMHFMIADAIKFNRDISNWNTHSVIKMDHMFYNAQVFNRDISNWNTASVTTMDDMFKYYVEHLYEFDRGFTAHWDTSRLIESTSFGVQPCPDGWSKVGYTEVYGTVDERCPGRCSQNGCGVCDTDVSICETCTDGYILEGTVCKRHLRVEQNLLDEPEDWELINGVWTRKHEVHLYDSEVGEAVGFFYEVIQDDCSSTNLLVKLTVQLLDIQGTVMLNENVDVSYCDTVDTDFHNWYYALFQNYDHFHTIVLTEEIVNSIGIAEFDSAGLETFGSMTLYLPNVIENVPGQSSSAPSGAADSGWAWANGYGPHKWAWRAEVDDTTLTRDIDLVALGYDATWLDKEPRIHSITWAKSSCTEVELESMPFVELELLNEDGVVFERVTEFLTSCSQWTAVAMRVSNYGTGLRHIRLTMTGNTDDVFQDPYVSVLEESTAYDLFHPSSEVSLPECGGYNEPACVIDGGSTSVRRGLWHTIVPLGFDIAVCLLASPPACLAAIVGGSIVNTIGVGQDLHDTTSTDPNPSPSSTPIGYVQGRRPLPSETGDVDDMPYCRSHMFSPSPETGNCVCASREDIFKRFNVQASYRPHEDHDNLGNCVNECSATAPFLSESGDCTNAAPGWYTVLLYDDLHTHTTVSTLKDRINDEAAGNSCEVVDWLDDGRGKPWAFAFTFNDAGSGADAVQFAGYLQSSSEYGIESILPYTIGLSNLYMSVSPPRSIQPRRRNEQCVEKDYTGWGLRRMSYARLDDSFQNPFQYDIEHTGQGVTIFVIDSGVAYGHPTFEDRVKYTHRSSMYFTDEVLDERIGGSNHHGTMVASCAAGIHVGTAPSANIASSNAQYFDKITGKSYRDKWTGATSINWACKYDWNADETYEGETSPPTYKRVVNLSFGDASLTSFSSDEYDLLRRALQSCKDNEIPVVVAAGNFYSYPGPTSCKCVDDNGWPAPLDRRGRPNCNHFAELSTTISVGNLQDDDTVHHSSGRGTCCDIYAPGTDVAVAEYYNYQRLYTPNIASGTPPNYLYKAATGTSYSAPYVAGIIAVQKSMEDPIDGPFKTPAEHKALLLQNSVNVGTTSTPIPLAQMPSCTSPPVVYNDEL